MTGAALTVIVTVLVLINAVSLAINRRTYAPFVENPAVVTSEVALPNVTVPAPLTLLHATVNLLDGNPSSVAVPDRFATDGNVTVWFGPALTTGAWLTGGAALTVIVTALVRARAVSFAISRSTYDPFVEKLARVFAVAAFVNVTVPGPLTLLHASVSVPEGNPSSVAEPESVAVDGSVIV